VEREHDDHARRVDAGEQRHCERQLAARERCREQPRQQQVQHQAAEAEHKPAREQPRVARGKGEQHRSDRHEGEAGEPPAARRQRSTAARAGPRGRSRGTAMAPMRMPISRLESANRVRSSPISGGTAKNVRPTAKKLTMALASTSQRRDARVSGVVTAEF